MTPDRYFRVYRIADAPQWMCDIATLARDNDPVIAIPRGNAVELLHMAALMISAYCVTALKLGEVIEPAEGGNDEYIIYTVNRG